jgi:hypothetical protein
MKADPADVGTEVTSKGASVVSDRRAQPRVRSRPDRAGKAFARQGAGLRHSCSLQPLSAVDFLIRTTSV